MIGDINRTKVTHRKAFIKLKMPMNMKRIYAILN